MPRPTFTQAEITERTIHRRAIEAVVWGMPAVNFDLMYKAAVRLKAEFNQIVYWSHLPDWKNQTLTPNADVIYLMPFFNTKDAGWYWKFRLPTMVPLREPLWTHGKRRSRMLGPRGSIEERVVST